MPFLPERPDPANCPRRLGTATPRSRPPMGCTRLASESLVRVGSRPGGDPLVCSLGHEGGARSHEVVSAGSPGPGRRMFDPVGALYPPRRLPTSSADVRPRQAVTVVSGVTSSAVGHRDSCAPWQTTRRGGDYPGPLARHHSARRRPERSIPPVDASEPAVAAGTAQQGEPRVRGLPVRPLRGGRPPCWLPSNPDGGRPGR